VQEMLVGIQHLGMIAMRFGPHFSSYRHPIEGLNFFLRIEIQIGFHSVSHSDEH
jgi:hypothetical protein